MTTPAIHFSILIFKGDPLDYHIYRHTALCVHTVDSNTSLIAEVVGPIGEFQFETREIADLHDSLGLAKTVEVG